MARPKKDKTPKAQAQEVAPNYDEKALFLQHLPLVEGAHAAIEAAKAKVAKAKADLKKILSAAAVDGFARRDFEYAGAFQTPEKEAELKATIARQLLVAQWLNADLGAQLELFLDAKPIPATDRAYQEGRDQAMANKPAKPDYAPGTEGYKLYLEGFHSISAERITSGFTPFTAEELENQQALADEASKH